jgi:hypothetical protein
MPYVGWSGVANLANTTDGFALGVGAQNNPAAVNEFGLDVGDGGVVDLYHNGGPVATFYILMENSGYVLQETDDKIILEIS